MSDKRIVHIRTKHLRKPSNLLLMNLAFSDMLMLHINIIFIYNSFSGGPAAGPFWCTYYGLIGGLSGTSAIMTIAMIAIERYECVSRPLDPSSRMTGKRALFRVLFVWSYAGVFSFTPLFGINRYVPEGFLTSCSFDYLSDELVDKCFIIVFFVAAWCIPIIIVSRCYVGIMLCLKKNRELFEQHSEDINVPDRNVKNQRRIEVRLIKLCGILILIWTASWTPYAMMALIGVFTDRSLLTPFISMLPGLTCKLASVFDPFVYGLLNSQFKNELVKILPTPCRKMSSFFKKTLPVQSDEPINTEENADSREECETAFVNEVVECVPRIIGSSEEYQGSNRALCVIRSSKSESKVDHSFVQEMMKNASLKSVHVMESPFSSKMRDVTKLTSRRSI
ncbi:opsin, ultraviolet-sensitive [Nephila pilipes]|uniref:Opsin, ultraviolet-sensitive n=1 Tax=Nephila pilipes TaxID=299642 RepID=A0A8X6M7S9_NEPPI|nr:opsin, ultraviolet-sensitive [Nephila pilipes]